MKQAEVKESSTEKLQEKLAEYKKAYTDLKVAHTVSPLENPIQIRDKRRAIARIATELTKRQNQ